MKPNDVRLNLQSPEITSAKYGTDKSGKKVYTFNSLGYRGEEYNPYAQFKIGLIGDSYSFGTGLNIDETFGYKFKLYIAESIGINVEDVNFTNFSAGGHSNDYCVRTIYRQFDDCQFDIFIYHLPPINRAEWFDKGKFQTIQIGNVNVDRIDEVPEHILGYFQFYSEYIGLNSLLKNLLLTQYFFRERKIPCIFVCREHVYKQMIEMVSIKPFYDQLNINSLFRHNFFSFKSDLAADGRHAGPCSNTALAIGLLYFYGQFLMRRGNTDWGGKIEKYASHIKETNADWGFCNAFLESFSENQKEAIDAARKAVSIQPSSKVARKRLRQLQQNANSAK